MKENRSALMCLIVAYILWNAASVLGGSFIYLYFWNAGLGATEIIGSFLFWAAAPIILIHALNRKALEMRALLLGGVVSQLISYSMLILLEPGLILLLAYSFLLGLTSFLFWVPFNTMFFSLSKDRAAWLGSIYFSLNPLLAVFLPLIGGLLAEAFGFGAVFMTTAIIFASVLFAAFHLFQKKECSYDVSTCLASLKSFKTILVLEGAYGGGMLAGIAVVSLLYFQTPSALGAFIAGTTLFAILASFIVSSRSDKLKKRGTFIKLSGGSLGIVSMAASVSIGPIAWSALMSARNFFATLFYPFTTAILVDNGVQGEHGMIGREWLLNAGRIIGVSVPLLFSLIGDLQHSFIFLGLMILVYPFIVETKIRSVKEE